MGIRLDLMLWFSTGANLILWGHLAMFGDILVVTTGEGICSVLASRTEVLLNSPTAKTYAACVALVLRLGSLV